MTGFNKVIWIGHLSQNPELKYTSSGTPIAKVALAVNRKDKQGDEMKEEVCYINPLGVSWRYWQLNEN
ncbi:MAG: single-stranded DNA-binding protein [Nitrospirae bacterium]|nr:single-stranded DNA-binding protein [Nitrospirota bacterium]